MVMSIFLTETNARPILASMATARTCLQTMSVFAVQVTMETVASIAIATAKTAERANLIPLVCKVILADVAIATMAINAR